MPLPVQNAAQSLTCLLVDRCGLIARHTVPQVVRAVKVWKGAVDVQFDTIIANASTVISTRCWVTGNNHWPILLSMPTPTVEG